MLGSVLSWDCPGECPICVQLCGTFSHSVHPSLSFSTLTEHWNTCLGLPVDWMNRMFWSWLEGPILTISTSYNKGAYSGCFLSKWLKSKLGPAREVRSKKHWGGRGGGWRWWWDIPLIPCYRVEFTDTGKGTIRMLIVGCSKWWQDWIGGIHIY